MANLRLVEATAVPLNLAGACGIPFVAAAGIIIQDIIKVCDELKLHKVRFSNVLALTAAEVEIIYSPSPSCCRINV